MKFTWMKRQTLKIIALSTLINVMGGIFSCSSLYADVSTVWTLNSSGAWAGQRSYTLTGFTGQSYQRNSNGTGILLWAKLDEVSVWSLNTSGGWAGQKGYRLTGWTAVSYHKYSDGTATLLWTKPNQAIVWYLSSSGGWTGQKGYTAPTGYAATSYVKNSDGTAALLWTQSGLAQIWFLKSDGSWERNKSYTLAGWKAHSYHKNSDGTASLLWKDSSNKALVWYLSSSGGWTGQKGYTGSSGYGATSYISSSAISAMKIATTKSIEGTKTDVAVITVQKTGSGNGTITAGTQVCDAACTELAIPYIEGEQIDVNVTAAADSYFAGWETAGGVKLEDIYYANPGEIVFAIFELK